VDKLDLIEDQFDRQKKITWWEQDRLLNSKVLVIGAGALGNEIVKNLALVGVGEICIVDSDVVDITNLSRCIFFEEHDIGKPKAKLLSEKIQNTRNIKSNYFVAKVQELGVGIFQQFDIVVGALDNREARSWVNEYSRMFDKPWVDGAIEGLNGLVRSFGVSGVCYECTLSEEDLRLLSVRKSCALLSEEDISLGKVPTTATSASIISGFQTQESLIYLSRKKIELMPLVGKQMTFFGETMSFVTTNLKEKMDCFVDHSSINFKKMKVNFNSKILDILKENNLDIEGTFFREIITSAFCADCKTKKELNLYINSIKQNEVICQGCSLEMQIETDKNISTFLELTLNQINFPDNELIIQNNEYILLSMD